MYSAVSAGILDEARGIYRNPVTGSELPIGAAMDAGLITATQLDNQLPADYVEAYILSHSDQAFRDAGKELVGVIDSAANRLLLSLIHI